MTRLHKTDEIPETAKPPAEAEQRLACDDNKKEKNGQPPHRKEFFIFGTGESRE